MKRYPLKFLDSYTQTDTDIFFGRDEEIDALYEMTFQTDILLLYGASGTGKTSLIQCGLASRFESHDWLDLYIRRGSNINLSLKNALTKVGGTLEEAEDLDWLDNIELEDDAEAQTAATSQNNDSPKAQLERQFKNIYLNAFRPLYLIFDQFEELYILGTAAEQQEFVDNVQTILSLDQPVKMIFSIREEYLGHLYDFERNIPQLLKKKLRIEPMNLTKVQAVIEGFTHVKNSNISLKDNEVEPFTQQVFERLQGKDEAGKRKRKLTIELPYLQVFLDKIYLEITGDKSRTAEAEFSLAALQNIGAIDDVLREFLETQVIEISQQLRSKYRHLNDEHIWQILSPFVTLDGTKEPIGIAIISKKVENTVEANSNALTQDLIEAFIKSKIIRYSENEDAYEIAHDSLAAKIAEKRTDEEIALLEVKRLIKSQAILKEDARELFTQKQLNFITPFLDKLPLEKEENQLIAESRKQITAQKEAERQRQNAELKAAQKQAEKDRVLRKQAEKSSRKAKRFTIIAVSVAIGAIALGVVAWQQQQLATTAKKEAQSSLMQSYKTDINRYRREINISKQNQISFIDYDADILARLEAQKIDSLQKLVINLDSQIKNLK